MKRIVILILTLIACSLVILICAGIREDTTKGEIMAEMQSRLETLARKTDTITASEYTPFIWTAEYPYECSTTLEKFNTLLEGREAQYIRPDEVDHREIYFYNNQLVFDTGMMRTEYWGFWDNRKILPQNQLDIELGDGYRYVFIDY